VNARIGVVLVVCLFVASLPAGIGAAGVGPGPEATADPASEIPAELTTASADRGAVPATASRSSASDLLSRTTVLRHRSDREDVFEAETTISVPDSVTSLELTLQSEATVTATDGFEQTDDGSYRWTETTDEPTIRFTMPTDRTGYDGHHERVDADRIAAHAHDGGNADRSAAHAHDGDGYTFVDTGDWAVVQVPSVGLSYSYTDPVGVEETVRVDGPGATGGDIAYFGPVTEYETAGEQETVRLAVADDASLAESPAAIGDALAAASDRLDVGASRDEVFVVAVPTDVDWAAHGIQYGESDAWVVADAPLDVASNVWLHEYVHTRQAFANPDVDTTTETEWLVEAQAEYYAALLALEQGHIEFTTFADALEAGAASPAADARLAEPTTWTDDRADYLKGALVAGELDRQLRLATDGDRSLDDVFRTVNRADGPLTETELLDAIESEGGSDVRAAAERYTRTEQTPEMWSRAAHEDAFEVAVAQFESGLDGPIESGGESWDVVGDSLTIPAGDDVTIPVSATNVGDREGTADVTLAVDGADVDARQFELSAGDEATDTLTWRAPEPGVYDVRVGSDRVTVSVRSPSSVTVTALRIDPDDAGPGEELTATATVEAADDRPGAAVLTVRTPDGPAGEMPVVVSPGEPETAGTTLTFDDAGSFEVVVGNQSRVVSIETGPIERVDSLPGFGPTATLVAIVAALLVARGRR